jgi:nucleotide-binding universal stress UspA family protein
MKPTVQKIVAKLAKEQSIRGLKPIQLNAMSQIEDYVSAAYGAYEMLEEALEDAQRLVGKAHDIYRFDLLDNIGSAEDEMEYLKDELEELGVDEPTRLATLKGDISELEKLANKAKADIANIGRN